MNYEIGNSPIKVAQSFQEPKGQSRIAYTRDFLLSLSELDVCKELPSGFDHSILSELEEAYGGLQDKRRNHGNFPLNSFRRIEHGSSPPTRGDSNNFSRGYGRWNINSGSWNDKDSDRQSDRDSDTGRRYGNLTRRSSQTSEQDGLLGSGSFSRSSSGYTVGLSTPKLARPNDNYQLNWSSEPYHPPRPYKVAPHGKRETKDSYNDETFGSSESTSQDKIEDERRRRASFELMRKEQHKSLQENQKHEPDKDRNGQVAKIPELLDDASRDLKRPIGTSDVDESANLHVLADSSKSSILSQVSRPRIPPGFKSTTNPEKDDSSELPDKDNGQESDAAVQSSKFAHWFIEDEKMKTDPTYGRPNNLLSFGTGDNKATSKQNMKEFLFLNGSSSTNQVDAPPKAVLTCEDLEQTILSEYGENLFTQKTTDLKSWDMQPKTINTTKADAIDNSASQHLLALLQKGNGSFLNGSHVSNDASVEKAHESTKENANSLAGKSPTLETLFGSAFMEELQSVDAPVSAQLGGGGGGGGSRRVGYEKQTKMDSFDGSVCVPGLAKEDEDGSIFSKSDHQQPLMNRAGITEKQTAAFQSPPAYGFRQHEMSIPLSRHNSNFRPQTPLVNPPFLNHSPHNHHQHQHPNPMNLLPSHHHHHSTIAAMPTTREGGGEGGGGYGHLPFHHPLLHQMQQRGFPSPQHPTPLNGSDIAAHFNNNNNAEMMQPRNVGGMFVWP